MLVDFFFLNIKLIQDRVILEEATSTDELPISDWTVGKTGGVFS